MGKMCLSDSLFAHSKVTVEPIPATRLYVDREKGFQG